MGRILSLLLKGDHPVLATLRQQVELSKVVAREFKGAGFFTTFAGPPSAARVGQAGQLTIRDVCAEMEGVEHDAGFILFVRDGRLDFLEGFMVDPVWPAEARIVRAFYVHHPEPGNPALVEVPQRDLAFACPWLSWLTTG